MLDIKSRARYDVRRDQAAFVRSLKIFKINDTRDYQPAFNLHALLRIHDMNPAIYVCAMLLLDSGVEEDPTAIQESREFRLLNDHLRTEKSHEESLVLLEVYTYMIIIHRARTAEEDERTAIDHSLEQQELIT